MDRKALRLVGFVSVAVAILSSPACKDDSEINNERPLPGPGPIGAGGGTTTGGAAGVAGTGGASGAGTGGTTTGGTGGTTGGAAGTGTGGMPASCPTLAGDAKIRLANLTPGGGIDVCVVAPGKTEPEGPLFQCAAGSGVPYKKVSKAFAFAAGAYEFRTVAPGATCGTTIASAMVTLGAGDSYVAIALGGGTTGEPAVLKALKTDPMKPSDGTVKLRFIHGIHKAFPLDLGLSAGGSLAAAVFSNVQFGGVGPAGPGIGFPVNDLGYAQGVSEFADPVEVGAAKTGEAATIFSAKVKIAPANTTVTAYGVGVIGDPAAPVGAFMCADETDEGNFTKCEDAVPVP